MTHRQREEIEAHLARCPVCRCAVADALAVADLLRSSPPAVASDSLAFTGNLWASLESEIARTPQDAPVNEPVSSPASNSGLRLQRVGSWLATPGAMPFGTVAAAAVVGMVGIALYQRLDVSPLNQQTAAVTGREDPDITEIKIISPLPEFVATVKGQEKKPAPVLSVPRGVRQMATAPSDQIAPLRRKVSLRRSARSSAKHTFSAPTPAPPRAPAFQMASAPAPQEYFATASSSALQTSPVPLSAPPAAAPTLMADAAMRPQAVGEVAENRNSAISSEVKGERTGNHLPVSPVSPDTGSMESRVAAIQGSSAFGGGAARAAAGPVALTPRHQPEPLTVVPGSSENSPENLQDSSAVRSVMDLALQQRRQRSLFSYATR